MARLSTPGHKYGPVFIDRHSCESSGPGFRLWIPASAGMTAGPALVKCTPRSREAGSNTSPNLRITVLRFTTYHPFWEAG